MIEIVSFKGEVYKFDPDTERIFKDGKLIPSTIAEPVFSDIDNNPNFSGIFLKEDNVILSKSGKINSRNFATG